jgi:hypothetical protein
MWPEELQSLLPKPAQDILEKQQARFQREWDIVAKSFLDMLHEEYCIIGSLSLRGHSIMQL